MINKFFNKFFLITFLFCFCSVLVYGEFSIGIYGIDDINELTTLKEAGFNVVQTDNKDPEYINLLATKAKENEMKILAFPNKIIGSKYKSKVLDYPLLAWYMYDDKNIEKSKNKLIKFNSVCKNNFPNNKTAFIFEKEICDIPDFLMIDLDLTNKLSLESIDDNIVLAKQTIEPKNKQLFSIIHLFDFKESKKNKVEKFYKKEEIRFLSYNSIVNGVTGLFYFNYILENKPLSKYNTKYWQEEVVDVIQEISFIAEIIDNGKEIENPEEIQEPLKAKSFEYGGIKYTILINPTSKRQTVPKLFFNPKFDVMYEKSTNAKKVISRGHNNFKPYKVLVFRYE